MVINIRSGNVLDSSASVIAHQVNCRGIMGAGVAKAIREKYSTAYYEYKEFCAVNAYNSANLLGKVQFARVGGNFCVANMFGQDGYGTNRTQTSYEALLSCFSRLRDYLFAENISCVALPFRVGCGLAGGDWKTVVDLMIKVFGNTDITIELWQFVPSRNLFGSDAAIVVDHIEDGVLCGEYSSVRFSAPADLFCECKDGDTLTFSVDNDAWVVNSDDTATRAENINNLWSGLNFQ